MDKNYPDWFWNRGLHDAKIISIEEIFYGDYKPVRNCLVLKLNANNAMFEIDIKELRFYNYKLHFPYSVERYEGLWWMSEDLTVKRISKRTEKYSLTITFADCRDNYDFSFDFDNAEVIRK